MGQMSEPFGAEKYNEGKTLSKSETSEESSIQLSIEGDPG